MLDDISIILISYKSSKLVKKFISSIPKNLPVIVIDNSRDYHLKNELEKKNQNIKVHIIENNGVSTALNFAVEKISTKYFLQISPDIEFKFADLKIFYGLAKKLNDNFAAIGPRFEKVNSRSHKQISNKHNYDSIDSINGSCMFVNKSCYQKIGGFDENFFLYFEETDYCHRGKKLGYKSYQTNLSKVISKGRSVNLENKNDNSKLDRLLAWHFIWSEYYYFNKNHGNLICIVYFLPTFFRSFIKMIFFSFLKRNKEYEKYKYRLNGLISSFLKKSSYLRINDKI
jgi:N-acetylglucosaminyl-diphospho-decaprenol L-rhamnosyltransferase